MSKKTTRDLVLSILLAGAVCAVLAYCQADTSKHSYAISIIERSAVYAVVAVAMNLLNGFTGLFSLGQAGFMAIGAYVTAILTIPVEMRQNVYYMNGIAGWLENLSIPMVPAMILGGLFAAAAAALIGIPVLRLKSDYLAIATLGFAEIIRALLAAPMMDTITNGSYGLNNIPGYGNVFQPMLIAAVCIGLMVLLINSSFGRAFKAIREDDVAAEAMGINLFRHKEMSFIISSFFTGVAGGMLAVFMRSIDTKTFQVALTYNILLIVVLGGIGSVTGSIIGSFLINGGQEWLRFLDQPLTIGGVEIPLFRAGFRMVIYSILLMVVVLFWRRGIMGNKEFTWDGLFGLFRRKRKRKETTGGEA
ncbi:MAG: branched-chain amino acid ABC transporter permease [Lachnospiraceae bacterium]|nr:branched-chain amino acid ABC transporter permease [Lachnospiraceae bacterium]